MWGGQIPEWLNTDNPKLHIVYHKDYIPSEWLPTFSSRCIDMNLHRIDGLSDQFVYFNDDMFLVDSVKPSDFFVNGRPCDTAILSPQAFELTDSSAMYIAPMVDTALINKHFSKKAVLKKNQSKWFNLKYGLELLRTFTMLPYPHFIGFYMSHLPYSYLKSTYEEVWDTEPEILARACSHRFREPMDANHWIFSYWQYATGNFEPRSINFGHVTQVHGIEDAKQVSRMIPSGKYKVLCINDAVRNNADFKEIVDMVNGELQKHMPEKSSFER